MDLEKLRQFEKLSRRAYNICRFSDLRTLDKILDWYRKYGYFTNIRNCGKGTSRELERVCIKYEKVDSESFNNNLNLGITLISVLSARAYNVCLYNGLNSVDSLLSYYDKNKSFEKFRNCGLKTNLELVAFCIGYGELIPKTENVEINELDLISYQDLSILQRTTLRFRRRQLLFQILEKSERRALGEFLGGYLDKYLFDKIVFNPSFDITYFNNLGGQSLFRISDFIQSYKIAVKSVIACSSKDDLINLNYTWTLGVVFPNTSFIERLTPKSIFTVVDFVIKNGLLFNKNELKIFKKYFKIYIDSDLESSSDRIELSKERVRQISSSIIYDLSSKFSFIINLFDGFIFKNGLFNSDIVFVDDSFNQKINNYSNTNFTKEWNAYLIFVYLSNLFKLIGSVEHVLYRKKNRSQNRHNWICFYIINEEIVDSFDFTLFVEDFTILFKTPRVTNIDFHIDSFISEKYGLNDSELIGRISAVIRIIIKHEFGLEPTENGNFSLVNNARRALHESAYSALMAIGRQATVKEITNKINELFPDDNVSENKVRTALKRKFGFVPIGRSSVFGLAQWENVFLNFKGGTIRNLVIDYLTAEGEPRHIDSITAFLKKYRPQTYSRSVWDNLRTDSTGNFIFWNNRYVGLKSYKYDSIKSSFDDYMPEKVKTWEESYLLLVNFINDHIRLPRSSGCPLEEVQLYRWFQNQIRYLDKGILDFSKSEQLSKIINKFPINQKRTRPSIVKDVEKFNSLILKILNESQGKIATKETLKLALSSIVEIDGELIDKILNKAPFLKRRLCLMGRPFYYYHTSSEVLDISRDYENIQDFILSNLNTADNKLEFYFKVMQDMINSPDPNIITSAVSRLLENGVVTQFYHKFIDMDFEILISNRIKSILDNLILGICESMSFKRDSSFIMDRIVYEDRFVKDLITYLSGSGVLRLVLNETQVEVIYLFNYKDDKILLDNKIEALFLPYILKNCCILHKLNCEYLVLGFNVKYNFRYNLIHYEREHR